MRKPRSGLATLSARLRLNSFHYLNDKGSRALSPLPFYFMYMDKRRKKYNEPASLEAQERLIEIMNDSPRVLSFDGTKWELRALKPGTQWLIAQEAIKIQKAESANMGDVMKQFAVNLPSVAKVLTLGLLNDRRRIFANGKDGEYSKEFQDTYTTILYDTKQENWLSLLVEMIDMLGVEVFFSITSSIQILRQRLLDRKMTVEEQKRLSRVRSSAG